MFHVYYIKEKTTNRKYIRINLLQLSQIILKWKSLGITQCHDKNLNTN